MRLAVLLSVLTLCGPLAAAPRNLMPNPDLEYPVPGDEVPYGWTFFHSPGHVYRAAVVRPGYQGGRGWRIRGQGQYGGAGGPRVEIKGDHLYIGSGQILVREGRATLKLDYFAGDRHLGQTFGGLVSAGQGWRQVHVGDHRVAYPTADHVRLALVLSGSGEAVFDDLAFYALPEAGLLPVNLLANGHCEAGVGAEPTALTPFGDARTGWTYDAAMMGWRGLTVNGERLAAGDSAGWRHAPVPRPAGHSYEASVVARARAGQAYLRVEFLRGEQVLGQRTAGPVLAHGDWMALSLPIGPAAFPTADRLAVSVALSGPGDADFDDLVLRELEASDE